MGFFDKMREPVFLKEDSEAQKQLAELRAVSAKCDGELKNEIEEQIKLLEAGIFGEETIKFELLNSHIPMYIIHDLFLEHNGLTAQIDYLIVTRKLIFVVECKNLYGNIEINSNGDFIRSFSYGKFSRKEGIYSPITQNKRHLDLMKAIRLDEVGGFLAKKTYENTFPNTYRSVVVLSNPKTILNAKYAKKEVKSKVIRADQLIEYIRSENAKVEAMGRNDKELMASAQMWLSKHKVPSVDYTEKYRSRIAEVAPKPSVVKTVEAETKPTAEVKPSTESAPIQEEKLICPKCGAEMVKRKATKGANAGKEFYGCSNFPKCRNIVNIE